MNAFFHAASTDPAEIVAHESGYAELAIAAATDIAPVRRENYSVDADKRSLKIVLQPWGCVSGKILMRDKPVADARFCLYQARQNHVFVRASQTATSDSNGLFVVDHLPAGPNVVCLRCVDYGSNTHHRLACPIRNPG
jgi:hypothetical protein